MCSQQLTGCLESEGQSPHQSPDAACPLRLHHVLELLQNAGACSLAGRGGDLSPGEI